MEPPPLIGLCAACRHAKAIRSARGSLFIMCGLAKTDSRFDRYPRLPVLACIGFQARSQDEKPAPDEAK